MKCCGLIILLLAGTVIQAQANLGETIQQTVVRYGKPMGFTEASAKSPFGTVGFEAGGYVLVVFVLNDREVGAQVSKVDKSAFTAAEMQTIMSNDSGSSKWTPVTSSDLTCLQWARADQATALYDESKRVLIFTSEAMAQALHPNHPSAPPKAG